MSDVRVRFAPSPTGPLHIGGVRTALYNYLFARHHGGAFILRIEDTDQQRYVEGAEAYIEESLRWLGLDLDESPAKGGPHGPYRQSERSALYQEKVQQLVEAGKAYYAFDTADEIAAMRSRLEAEGVHSPKYNSETRLQMSNSLTLSQEEVQVKIEQGLPYVVRLKVDPGHSISFNDEVRGQVTFSSDELDDKVLLKSDGLPTYHLANVVDDHSMKISHVIRGEEWLSSTPLHVLLYQAFGWKNEMPTFVHLPLILKPVGKGKLSKRDGAKFGFPVFPLLWQGEETYQGFREMGYLPDAVVNFLALLGWNPGTEQEMMSQQELTELFSLEKINKSGARFDIEKALWFNQQYLMRLTPQEIYPLVQNQAGFDLAEEAYALKVIEQIQTRVQLITDFEQQSHFFFAPPKEYDEKMWKKKWKGTIVENWSELLQGIREIKDWNTATIETTIKQFLADHELGFGAVFPLLRIAISGTTKGPDLFESLAILGQEESIQRLERRASQS